MATTAISFSAVAKDCNLFVGQKLEWFISTTGNDSEYETVGVVENESSFNLARENMKFKDGKVPFCTYPVGEMITVEGHMMQVADPNVLALAMGRSTIEDDSTTDNDKKILLDSDIAVAPKYLMKFLTETVGGKAFEIVAYQGQVVTEDVALAFGATEFAKIPIKIEFTVDPTSTEASDVGYIGIEQ